MSYSYEIYLSLCSRSRLRSEVEVQTNLDELKHLQSMVGKAEKHFMAECMQIIKADSLRSGSLKRLLVL